MINQTLCPASESRDLSQTNFNAFTIALVQEIDRFGMGVVRLRNGMLFEVFFKKPTKGENEQPIFYAQDFGYIWSASGRSTGESSKDMILLYTEFQSVLDLTEKLKEFII